MHIIFYWASSTYTLTAEKLRIKLDSALLLDLEELIQRWLQCQNLVSDEHTVNLVPNRHQDNPQRVNGKRHLRSIFDPYRSIRRVNQPKPFHVSEILSQLMHHLTNPECCYK